MSVIFDIDMTAIGHTCDRSRINDLGGLEGK